MKPNSPLGLVLLGLLVLLPSQVVAGIGPEWFLENKNYQTDLRQVEYLNGRFIAVGDSGVVLESDDGASWQNHDVPGASTLWGIAYGHGRYVVVGSDTMSVNVWWSTNLQTWQPAQACGGGDLFDVIFTGSEFMAVGEVGRIASSVYGGTWTTESSGTTEILNSIAFSGQYYVAVGRSTTILHKNEGAAWSDAISGITESDHFNSVVWNGSQFVITGYSTVCRATVPLFWTQDSGPPTDGFSGIEWTGSEYVLISDGGYIYTSVDAQSWDLLPRTVYQDLWGVAWGGTTCVVVGKSGVILSAEDMQDWIVQSTTAGTIKGIASTGSLICAFEGAGIGGHALYSTDGISWQRNMLPEGMYVHGLKWTGSRFVGASAHEVYWSSDCISWHEETVPSLNLQAATGSNEDLFAVDNYGFVYYNIGSDWYQGNSPLTSFEDLRDVESTGSVQVAVGDSIIVSTNRIDWADVAPTTGETFYSVATDGQSFVAVGNDSIVFSPEGFYWSVVATGLPVLRCVEYMGGQFLAFSSNSDSQWVSFDGQTWVEETLNLPNPWAIQIADGVESHGRLRIVGTDGNILIDSQVFADGFESGDTSEWSIPVR